MQTKPRGVDPPGVSSDSSTNGFDEAQHGAHTPDNVTSIESLPVELLDPLLAPPWISALVCSRWRDLAGANVDSREEKRTLYASSALSVFGHLLPCEIHVALQSVLQEATYAHTLPLLLASEQAVCVDYALDLWSDKARAIGNAEAAQWAIAHSQIESRFDTTWPDHIRERAHLICDHDLADVRAIASCVLLSVVARRTHSPHVLQRAASLCSRNQRALCKAIFVAAADDRRDIMGALLYLYAQYFLRPQSVRILQRVQHQSTVNMLATVHTVIGTWASTGCALVISLFHPRNCVAPAMIMAPFWSDHIQCQRCALVSAAGHDDGVEKCALSRLGQALARDSRMCTTMWIGAAIAADRPETLDMYVACFRDDPLPSIFGDAARMGKARLCKAIMAARPDIDGPAWRAAVNAACEISPFTLEGVRWLATQAWYWPQQTVPFHAVNDIFCSNTQGTGHTVQMRNAVDALGIMVDAWNQATKAALFDRHASIGGLLVSCIIHDECDPGGSGRGGLLDALVGHLQRCDFMTMSWLETGSQMTHPWAYLITKTTKIMSRGHINCKLCRDTPMSIVFGHLLRRHLDAMATNGNECFGPHTTAGLHPIHSSDITRTVRRASVRADDASLVRSLSYLARHGLLIRD